MRFKLNDRDVADNTVLLFGIRYLDPETYGSRGLKVFTYAGLKAGGRWYFTGSGRVPQDAGWGAVERWLDDPRREVMWVKVASKLEPLWERVTPE